MTLPAAALPFLGLGSESAVHQLGDLLPDGLFTTDLGGRVTYWNRAAERITGWTREEALGRDCSILAGDSVRGCACGLGPIRCGMVERERTSKTCTIQAKDGRVLLIVKSAVPVFAPGGEPVGALETFTEVKTEVSRHPPAAARRVARAARPRPRDARARADDRAGGPVRRHRDDPGRGAARSESPRPSTPRAPGRAVLSSWSPARGSTWPRRRSSSRS